YGPFATSASRSRLRLPRTTRLALRASLAGSERFNGRIAEVLAITRFDSSEHLIDTIKRYVQVYNQHIPQKALGHITPIQAMKNGYRKQPNLFNKRIYNLAGLD
ncbi:MAG: Mobile element protein, partial [Olavius algarvensis Gamma 1 endosymbiont]